MKNKLAILCAITMLFFTHFAYAESSGDCGAGLTWKLDSNGVLTISGTGAMVDCRYGTAPWKDVKDNIYSVVIEDGVTSIGDSAFSWCRSLTSVTMPDSLLTINDNAFENCNKLTSITLSNSLETIGSWAFYGCENLMSLSLPDSLKTINDLAFSGCESITELSIPASVEYIDEDRTFMSCDRLVAINVAPENTRYVSVDGVLYNAEQTTLLTYPAGKPGTSFTVPDSVIKINDYAFYWNEIIESIIVGNSVTSVGDDAFAGCENLTSLTLSEGLTSIGDTAFYRCSSLPSITFPASLTKVGNDLFESCYSLTEINVAENSTAFSSIDGVLFDAAGTRLIAYPVGKVQGVYTIPEGVEVIADYAFLYCDNLINVQFPSTLMSIGISAFSGCSLLTNLELPESLISIDDHAFSSCDGLNTVVIPASVTSLGSGAFSWCDKLMEVTVMGQYTAFDKYGVFDYCEDTLTIKGLAGSTAEHAAADEGFNFVVIESGNDSNNDNWTCPECSTENIGGKFCTECGAQRPEAQTCASCGYVNETDKTLKFCPECGTSFE